MRSPASHGVLAADDVRQVDGVGGVELAQRGGQAGALGAVGAYSCTGSLAGIGTSVIGVHAHKDSRADRWITVG